MKPLTPSVIPGARSTLVSIFLICILGLSTGTLVSCKHAQGQLELVSSTNRNVSIDADFRTVVYKQKNANAALIILSDVERTDLLSGNYTSGNILIIDMFLRPKAGSTPIEPTATNATLRHVILVGEEMVGVYGGGGFFYPTTKASKDYLSGEIANATLKVIQNSSGFADRLQTLEITGGLRADRADDTVTEIAYAINTEVSRRLGHVYFVIPD